jgi:DNA invertase Pin-like site-specific DNA recombinase
VSTPAQNLHAQVDALRAAGCERVFMDKLSGKLRARPGLDAARAYLRPGDVLVVTQLDRLARSLRQLVDLVDELASAKVDLHALAEQIDTSTPPGRLMLHVFGALAEFQRQTIVANTKDGLAAARARGRRGGRPRLLDADKLSTAQRMYDERQHTAAQIAAVVGCSERTLWKYLQPTENRLDA